MEVLFTMLVVLIDLVLICLMYIWSPLTDIFSVIYYIALYFNAAVIIAVIAYIYINYRTSKKY